MAVGSRGLIKLGFVSFGKIIDNVLFFHQEESNLCFYSLLLLANVNGRIPIFSSSRKVAKWWCSCAIILFSFLAGFIFYGDTSLSLFFGHAVVQFSQSICCLFICLLVFFRAKFWTLINFTSLYLWKNTLSSFHVVKCTVLCFGMFWAIKIKKQFYFWEDGVDIVSPVPFSKCN